MGRKNGRFGVRAKGGWDFTTGIESREGAGLGAGEKPGGERVD